MYRVLLVDDDVNMLALLKQQIPWERYGYAIMGTVTNGEDALGLMEKTMPNLIITDVRMPVMDGLTFCKKVRQLRDDIPIILLSAYEDLETARIAMKYNVTEYLLKPLNQQNIQLLCQILQEMVHNYEQQSFFTEICNQTSRQNEIAEHLAAEDEEWFRAFFVTYTNCFSIRFQLVQSTCITMLKLLYAKHPDSKHLLGKYDEQLQNCATKLEMVSLVAQLYDKELHASEGTADPIDYQGSIFQQIFDYVEHNFMLPDCGASMLAERFHFSADHISRLFGRYTGETLNVYINKKRMEYALELLHRPELSINEVAERSGFRNQNYFSRVFRKHLQVSPTEYRLQFQMDDNFKKEEEGLRE